MSTAKPVQPSNVLATDRSMRYAFHPEDREAILHCLEHYDDPRADTIMEPGMTFTIEPMLTLGGIDYEIWDDAWTVVTRDRRRSAQFEHTLAVTDTGAEILTLPSS